MSPKRDYQNTNLTPFKTLELMMVITGSHSVLPVFTQHQIVCMNLKLQHGVMK